MAVHEAAFLAVAFALNAAIVCGHGHPALPPPYTCTTTTTMCQPGDASGNTHVSGTGPASQGRPGKRGEIGQKGVKGEKGDPCQCDIADENAMREMKNRMRSLEAENLKLIEKMNNIRDTITPTNCSQASKLSGTNILTWTQVYPLKTIGDWTPQLVACPWDGWIVIQRRADGSVDFFRDWENYARGFGDKNGEFWLGLRAMHHLTSNENYNRLRIDLRFKDGSVKYAEYSSFRISGEESGFRLEISGYSGNAVDRMKHHNGQRFTTKDRDHDQNSGVNCAQPHVGAWWYKSCFQSNLNGRYSDQFMWPWASLLAFSEMKI